MVYILVEQWGNAGEHPGERGGVFSSIKAAKQHVADTVVHDPVEMNFYIYETVMDQGKPKMVEVFFDGKWGTV